MIDLFFGGNGKVEVGFDSGVNGVVESFGFVIFKGYVGNGIFMFGFVSSGDFLGSFFGVFGCLFSSLVISIISIWFK